jgi:hypothetical protein
MEETEKQLLIDIRVFREMVENIEERIAESPEREERQSLERELEGLEHHVADLKMRLNLLENGAPP